VAGSAQSPTPGVILNGLQAVKDLARIGSLPPGVHIRFTPDASQAQHDA